MNHALTEQEQKIIKQLEDARAHCYGELELNQNEETGDWYALDYQENEGRSIAINNTKYYRKPLVTNEYLMIHKIDLRKILDSLQIYYVGDIPDVSRETSSNFVPVQSFYLSDLYFAINHAPIPEQDKDTFRKIVKNIQPHFTRGPIKVPEQTKDNDIEIAGIIYRHGEDDYELWEGFSFSPEEEIALSMILQEHDTEGCSIRGSKQEIADDFVDDVLYEK